MNKISIIGTGSVGSTIAYTLVTSGICSELVMIDINGKKASGEALDIKQGVPFCPSPVNVYAGTYLDAEDSDIVIITSGVARHPGQSRLDLAQINVNITKSIIPEIVKHAPEAKYIIVSNPVDVLTYLFHKKSGLPEEQIIGSGTILDTARLRERISEYYDINQKNVHAYVFGEHGDSSFIPWSVANISNVPLSAFRDSLISRNKDFIPEIDYEEIEKYVRESGAHVISRKGATFYAVSISVVHICRSILAGVDTTMTVSTMMHGEYGIEDVCLSTLNIINSEGASGKILVPLNDDEIEKLRYSANTLKEFMAPIDFS